MIESKNDASRNLEKALQALEQAKQASTRFSIVKRSKGKSAVEKHPISAGAFLSVNLTGRPTAQNTMRI